MSLGLCATNATSWLELARLRSGTSSYASWTLRSPTVVASSPADDPLERLEMHHLSRKPIPSRERLIVALDVPSYDSAIRLVDRLGEDVAFYKLGLELFVAGAFQRLSRELLSREDRVFADLKLLDVPITVSRAVERIRDEGLDFVTLHGVDRAMVEAACAVKGSLKVLAVTLLTSLDDRDLQAQGDGAPIEEVVLSRARSALDLGCDGVVSSGLEAPLLRADLGDDFLIVTPGIRGLTKPPEDDQKRTVDVEEAFYNGSDYIVVGRDIHASNEPVIAARRIQSRIREVFAG